MSASLASLSRRRARFAFQRLSASTDKKVLAQDLKRRPVQVRNLGLSTTLALMMKDEKEAAARTVRTLLIEWLTHDDCPTMSLLDLERDRQEPNVDHQLLDWCLEADNASYRAVQAEAVALLDQAKILAAALDAAPSKDRERNERTGRSDG